MRLPISEQAYVLSRNVFQLSRSVGQIVVFDSISSSHGIPKQQRHHEDHYRCLSLMHSFSATSAIIDINHVLLKLHCVLKKVPTFKLSVTLSNVNRFLKVLHCWEAYEICYKTRATLPTSPQACCYTTLGN